MHATRDESPEKSEANALAAFSELFSLMEGDESPASQPQPAPEEEADETEDEGEAYAPLSAEITHRKWFTEELGEPPAEALTAPKPSRPAVRLADPQSGSASESVQQSLSALDTSCDWPSPALPQDDEFALPEVPATAPAPVLGSAAPERRMPPAFTLTPRRRPFASPLTPNDGAPGGMEASLSALESVLGGAHSPASAGAAAVEAQRAAFRREPPKPEAYKRSPLGQIADRIVRELEGLPAMPHRAG